MDALLPPPFFLLSSFSFLFFFFSFFFLFPRSSKFFRVQPYFICPHLSTLPSFAKIFFSSDNRSASSANKAKSALLGMMVHTAVDGVALGEWFFIICTRAKENCNFNTTPEMFSPHQRLLEKEVKSSLVGMWCGYVSCAQHK